MEIAEYDLIVAGAGPAGSACAITAARAGAKVLLLEKDRFPRHKVCGEFVSPESLQLLEWLLGEQKFQDRPQIAHARIFSGRKTISLPISPPARSIARFELDKELLEAARRAGAEVKEETTVRHVEQEEIFHVQTVLSAGAPDARGFGVAGRSAGAPDARGFGVAGWSAASDRTDHTQNFTARAVVNSTGRWSQLTQPAAVSKHKWIGLKGHFREAAPSPTVDLYFFDSGYCGVQPVSETAVNACAMVRSDAARSLEEVFSRQPELWQRSRSWDPLFPAITTSPLYFREPQTESNGMVLAGDAAAFIDPFAGDGISLALHSGALAAECLLPFVNGKSSLQQTRQQYRKAYFQQFAPAFRNAARVRMMLSTPPLIRSLLVSLVGIRPFAKVIVRSTRVKNQITAHQSNQCNQW